MSRDTENKIILVIRETPLEGLLRRYNTLQQAKFYVEHLGEDFSDYLQEHERYAEAISSAKECLGTMGRVQSLDRRFLPNFLFGAEDLVVVLGQDGLVANTLKYLDQQPVIGVNPDPGRYDGVLLPFRVGDLEKIVREVFAGRRRTSSVTMAQAELTDGQVLYAVNDLFIGARSHVSARYRILVSGKEETQSSSGIIVSTGLGSTGWLRGVLAGAAGIVKIFFGQCMPEREFDGFPWDSDYLCYSVREPFPSASSGASICFGKIDRTSALTVVSQMPDYGVIFSDGVESDFLEFRSGMTARVGIADKQGYLVV